MAHFGKDLDSFNANRTVQIINSEINEHFTTYVIEVTIGAFSWTVKHRYSEFNELHEKLTAGYKLDKSLLPPKKLFGNQTEAFVRKRQQDLQVYLQTVLHYLANHPPPALTFFLDFHLYEIHGITQAMAEDLYNRGEVILQTQDVYQMTPLQLYSLTERLKLPEPTCDSGDVKKDLGHILDFITRTKNLQICGSSEPVGTSNIIMNNLKFDLGLFKSLQSLEVMNCNLQMMGGLETIKQTLKYFNVYHSAHTIKEIVLQDTPKWKGEDGTQIVGGWDHVTHVDFSHNFIKDIDDSIQILWQVERLDMSYNQLESMQNLQWLSSLTHLDLSHNRLRVLDSLHTKLGNLTSLSLSSNAIESLQGFSKLFSLEMLDVSSNKIGKLEDVQPVCHLPCLEKLHLTGNPITLTVDYRTKVLEMFGDRVEEVYLDNLKATQKEKDTVAVRLALQKARETKHKQAFPKRNPSSSSLSDVYGRGDTPPLPSNEMATPSHDSLVPGSYNPASVLDSQNNGNIPPTSCSAPHNTPPHPWSLIGTSSRLSSGNIFIPSRHSPSQTSVSSCASAHEVVIDVEPVPEAHPFDHMKDANPTESSEVKEGPHKLTAASLPSMSSLDFVSWLEDGLLSMRSSSSTASITDLTLMNNNFDSPLRTRTSSASQVLDIIWCYIQQYTSPGFVIYPCCAVLTTSKIIVERISGSAGNAAYPTLPELQPCIILPLRSIQQVVIGPCYSYLRLEESFVGRNGLFTLFSLEGSLLKHFVDSLYRCCVELDATNVPDLKDLSQTSDLLTEISKREETLGLPSDRFAFAQLVGMSNSKNKKGECLLVLSENKVYCLDVSCVYWPPATFESAHEDAIHLKVLLEFSIVDEIIDVVLQSLSLEGDGPDIIPHSGSSDKYYSDFSHSPLIIQVETETTGLQEVVFGFSSSASRDLFHDRMTNLRTEHAHRMFPAIREAPEGGNESASVTDNNNHCSPWEKSTVIEGILKQNCLIELSNEAHVQQTVVPSTEKLNLPCPCSSLPLSFDWKKYYFSSVANETQALQKQETKLISHAVAHLSIEKQEALEGPVSVLTSCHIHNPQLKDKIEEDAIPPTLFELEMRQAVRSYDLLHPMPPALYPISLMSGKEVIAFFDSKVAGALSSASLTNELSVSSASSTHPEELRHILWACVIPYSHPEMEVVSLVMLSSRAIYLVSDTNTTSVAGVRPSWMTHARNKSDSAVGWQTQASSHRGSSNRSQWCKVKPHTVLLLTDLIQISVGLFDQFLRLTGSDAQTVFTIITRDCRLTGIFVDKLKGVLSNLVTSPVVDKNPLDIEQDFYHAFAKRTNSTVEGLVYTHPSKVMFLYPGDDAIEDILFLIRAKIQETVPKTDVTSLPGGLNQGSEVLWLYILGYQLLPPFNENQASIAPERCQMRTILVTSEHICLAQEDVVTYPLPDFVRGLPEQPQHSILETRRLESLKRITTFQANPHLLSLVFWDEPEVLVVDASIQHFSKGETEGIENSPGTNGIGTARKSKGILPEVIFRLYVQSQKDKEKLVQILQKQWRELVPQVGRMLDVVRE